MGTFLTILGMVVGGIYLGVKNYKANEARQNTAFTGYQQALEDANDYIIKAEDLYNQTRNEISNEYSADIFNLLEEQYNKINEITGQAVSNGGISLFDITQQEDSFKYHGDGSFSVDSDRYGAGKIKEVNADFNTDYQKHGITTAQLTKTDELYNLLATGDSSLAQSLRLSGNQISNMLDTSYRNATRQLTLGSSTLEAYSSQLRQANIQGAENIAQARSTMASSGIRQTGTANANENLARLQADLDKVAYAVQLKSQALQIKTAIQDLQTTSSISAYEQNAQIEISKRKNLEKIVNTYGSGTRQAEETAYKAKGKSEEAEAHRKEAVDASEAGFLERITGLD